MNGAPATLTANGGRRPGYPPANSGPMPAYRGPSERGPNGRGMPGYPPRDSGPMTAYRPPNNGQAYRPPNGRPATGYSVLDGAPPVRYPPRNSGPMPAYPMPAPPAPAYPPPLAAPPPRPAHPAAGARPIMGWLPFGQRLVLLPKTSLPGDDDEELREHRDVSGGWLRPAVFGAMDGLVTNSSLIAGIGGSGGAHGMIVLTGIAGLIAGAFSMATGEYISVKSQNELTQAEVELERRQHRRDPARKLRRLTEIYIADKGVSPNLAEAVARQISADSDRAVETHVREELGIDPDDLPSPVTAAVASFSAFTVGALIPLSPFLVGYPILKVALALAGAAALIGGAAVAKLTGRSMLLGGLRQFSAAAAATGAAFAVGHLIGTHAS
jgi:vacuolar iron transporter family protein